MESPFEFGEHETIVLPICCLMFRYWGTGTEMDLSIVTILTGMYEIRARESRSKYDTAIKRIQVWKNNVKVEGN